MTADLDTVLIARYAELTGRIIPAPGFTRHGPGKPPEVTDAELACLAELVRLMDATPVPCGQPVITAHRPDLSGYAGHGYCPSHSRWYRGSKLMLICTSRDRDRVRPGQPRSARPARTRPNQGTSRTGR